MIENFPQGRSAHAPGDQNRPQTICFCYSSHSGLRPVGKHVIGKFLRPCPAATEPESCFPPWRTTEHHDFKSLDIRDRGNLKTQSLAFTSTEIRNWEVVLNSWRFSQGHSPSPDVGNWVLGGRFWVSCSLIGAWLHKDPFTAQSTVLPGQAEQGLTVWQRR